MKEISLEYLAGVVDGEGCILIGKCKRKENKRVIAFSAHMTISNTHIPLLESIMIQFGGRITTAKTRDKTFTLYFSASEIRNLLPKLVPFLIIKKNQAEILLDFLKQMESNKSLPVSDELYTFYEKCYWQLRDLKKIRYEHSNIKTIIGQRTCPICNKSFLVYSTHHYKKYCSRYCLKKARWTRWNATQRTRKLLGSDVPDNILNN